jgi:mono/diheme cytochrome c family protein
MAKRLGSSHARLSFITLTGSPRNMSRKSLLKALRYFFAGVLLIIVASIGVIYGASSYRLSRKHAVTVREIPIPSDAVTVQRGHHLVTTRGCMDCHGADLGGAKVIDDAMAGKIHGANLTRGAGGLPADYSDVDFLRAIRHGVTRDGRPLVLMPSQEYTTLSDEDVSAMIAYLKTVPAVDRPRGQVSPGPIVRLLMVLGEVKLATEEIDHNATQLAAITPAVSVEYGKYLAAACIGCHGPNLSGGKIPGAPPDWPAAENLTPHESTRIREWTETQFVDVLRTQQRPDGSKLHPVMPAAFGQMNDVEIKALWAYIRTLPPAPHAAR